MITLYEIYPALDPAGLWINENNNCMFYENKNMITAADLDKKVIYITVDAAGMLTLEIEGRKRNK